MSHTRPHQQFDEQVRRVASNMTGVMGIEKCRIRKSGLSYFVDIHVEVKGEATVREGHEIAGRVRSRLCESNLRIADAHVHIEPYPDP